MTNHDIALSLLNGRRGGFLAALANAYCVADSGNRKRIESAFPHVFTANLDVTDVEDKTEASRAA